MRSSNAVIHRTRPCGAPAAAVAAWERGDLDMVSLPSSEVRRVLDTPEYAANINRGTTLSIEYYDFANCPDAETCPPNAIVGSEARIPGGSPSQNQTFRIATDQDYYDQMHFVHDCRAFTGEPPSRFLAQLGGLPAFHTFFATANRPRSD